MPILRKEMLAWKAQAELVEEQKCSIAWELHLSEGRVQRLEGRVRWLLGRVRDLEAALQSQTPLVDTAWDGEDEKDDDEEEETGQQVKAECDEDEALLMMKEEEEEEAEKEEAVDPPVARPSKAPRLL